MHARIFNTFPADLEADFLRAYNEHAVQFARIGILLAIVLYMTFYLWDLAIDPENASTALMYRIGVFTWFVVVSLVPIRVFTRHLQTLMAVSVTIAGTGVSAIILQLENGLNLGVGGIVLVLMFNFGFFRLLFVPSLIAGLLICSSYNVAAVIGGLPTNLIFANNFFLVSALVSGASVTYLIERLFRNQFLIQKDLDMERARAEELIHNLLPTTIASRLKAGEKVIAESHGEATVLFSDLVGFTTLTKRLSPSHLIEVLNDVFSILDELTERHGVEKIKTIGDAYMVIAGAGITRSNSAQSIADFALEMVDRIRAYAAEKKLPIALRVGISTGQVISGVIGLKRLSFDLWGETVNLASRLESNSKEGRIQVSETTYWRLRDAYEFDRRGPIDVKGIGTVEAYFLLGRKADAGVREHGAAITEQGAG